MTARTALKTGEFSNGTSGENTAGTHTMITAARARGFSPADDNEADAIAILFWALETRGGVQ